ncbi:hypothetical protein KSF_066420 [Reticulibacter mediterranei]|uniref:Nucleoside phosphorylase domain-containing protein n=1 Tax=Reticulibacter mediterranei TaxID=2778369 RepID=A0A8J3N2Z4_9CHLR|nr:SIR2 family protein [Reticulibacter mediterranei]GHO96594.1 hypothetical protein KSF_066420 [Reticulibacter mediterranei]
MELPLPMQRLAQMLSQRREGQTRPYHLLLPSAISFTPQLMQSLCQISDWNRFRTYIQEFGHNDRIRLLKNALSTTENRDGYDSLARLIAKDFFSTILTTNLDSRLEEALVRQGLPPVTFKTLVVGRDTDEYIAESLDKPTQGVHIIKLHGSLIDGVLPHSFPDFFELRSSMRQSLQRYLNQDLVIVGSLEQEDDLIRLFSRAGGASIYYATPHEPQPDDAVIKVITARHYDARNFVIAGSHGSFGSFFQTLETILLSNTSLLSAPDTKKLEHSSHSKANTSQQAASIYEAGTHQSSSLILGNTSLTSDENTPATRQTVAKRRRSTTDLLLVTVTEIEAKAVIHAFEKENDQKVNYFFIGDKTYYDLGEVEEAGVVMVQSEMGSGGPGGSLLTIEKAIQALSPSAIIMVGIAFGCDPKKQGIGDILVSRQLVGYELQRVGSNDSGEEEIRPRGDRPSASTLLLDRFVSGLKDWLEPPTVHIGLILSGQKLIDHVGYRERLRKLEPEAIGGEMEGAGLYAAAERNKIDWILVKAICDWADGNKGQNKNQYQQQAAQNAARFTIHVLRRGGFTPSHFPLWRPQSSSM